MSRIAFFNVPAAGHTNPTIAVTDKLVKRGHEVWYYSFDVFREKIEQTGATFISCDEYMTVSVSEIEELLVEDFAALAEMAIDTTVNMEEKVHEELSEFQPDCVIYDSLCIWGQLYAKKFGIPYVCSTTTLAMNKHSVKEMDPSFKELFQVITGLPRMNKKMKKLQKNGFDVKNVKHLFQLIENDNETETIVYTSEKFQPDSETFSDKYAFVGPSFEVPITNSKEKKRPMVYIALGSMLNEQENFYQQCIKALKDEAYEVIMSVGDETNIESFGKLPKNIKMYPRVEQLKVLRDTDIFITHSGMNSINESLYFSVPSVLYPFHSEEEMIADRVTELGAGKILEAESAEDIGEAVRKILNDSSYKINAQKIAQSFREAGGAVKAADKVENYIEK